MQVTRKSDPHFKHLRSLIINGGNQRTHTLLLGKKLILAWLQADKTCQSRFKPNIWLRLEGAAPSQLERQITNKTIILSESLMRELADAGSPPEHALIVNIGTEPQGPLPARVIVPWGIQNPGNLGAVLRSAAAFGFQEIILGPSCADPFSPKSIRGSMGAIFLMPLRRAENINSIKDNGYWFALDSGPNSTPLNEVALKEPLRILIGNEGHGWQGSELPSGIQRITIPTCKVESLNAAVATGIVCFEVAHRLGL
jgi:TrmH family RNA methyltransferase